MLADDSRECGVDVGGHAFGVAADVKIGPGFEPLPEFRGVLERYEERVRELAEIGVDLIHPEGAPPFMVHGADGEREIVGRWEKQYNIPIFTSAQLQIDVMRALGMRAPGMRAPGMRAPRKRTEP